MAKEIPWFKFDVTEWMTGNIVYESLEVQGLFINICSLYWKNLGVLSVKNIEERFRKKSLIEKLSGRFFSVSDGYISIDFLDEQLSEKQLQSKINSINGSKGGKAKAKRNFSESKQPLSDGLAKPSNIEEEVEIEVEEEKEIYTPKEFLKNELINPQWLMPIRNQTAGLWQSEEHLNNLIDEFCELKQYEPFNDSRHRKNSFVLFVKNKFEENKKNNGTGTQQISSFERLRRISDDADKILQQNSTELDSDGDDSGPKWNVPNR